MATKRLAMTTLAATLTLGTAHAATFSDAVTTCGIWVQRHYEPNFDVYLNGPDNIRVLGISRSIFEFDRCMASNGYPMRDRQ